MEEKNNTFKYVVMGVFGVFVIIGLIAFSSYKSSSNSANSVQINIWGTVDKNIFDTYVEKYKEVTNNTLNVIYTYKSLDTIDSNLIEAIATGKGPDVILVPSSLEKRYLDKVYMITTIPIRTFQDTFVQEANLYIQPNGIFALPFFVDPMVMYWNRDMFASANIAVAPKKWSEFPLLAQSLSQSDSNANILKSAVSFGGFSNINNAKALISTLILQAGSPIVSVDNNGIFKSELNYQSSSDVMVPAVSALQFYTDYSNPKKSVYSWNSSLPSSKQSFLSEDLATYFGFASEYQDIKDTNPNLNFDIATMPQVVDATSKATFGQLYGFSILKSSPNIGGAFSLITTLISNVSVSAFLQVMPVAPARNDIIVNGSTNPVQTIVFNSAIISKGWIDPDTNKTDQIFKDMIDNITSGNTDVSTSVSQASAKIDDLLKQ